MATDLKLSQNRPYQRLLVAKVSNELSSAISVVALPLAIVAVTQDVILAGAVVAITSGALVISQALTGAAVDRWGASFSLRISSALQALGWLLVLVGIFQTSVFLMFFGALIAGAASGIDGPAEQRLMKLVVAPAQMGRASAVGQGREAAAELLGGPSAGWLFAIQTHIPFLAQIVLNTLAAFATPKVREKVATRGGRYWVELAEGFKHVFADGALRGIALISGIANLAMALTPLTLIFEYQRSGIPAPLIGTLSTFFGAGVILGAFLAGWMVERFSLGVLGIVALSGFALAQAAIAFGYQNFWFTCAIFTLSAVLLPPFNASVVTYMNVTSDEQILGRVTSATGVPGMILMPIGSLLAGLLFEWSGAAPALYVSAIAAMIAAIYMGAEPQLRRMPKLSELCPDQ